MPDCQPWLCNSFHYDQFICNGNIVVFLFPNTWRTRFFFSLILQRRLGIRVHSFLNSFFHCLWTSFLSIFIGLFCSCWKLFIFSLTCDFKESLASEALSTDCSLGISFSAHETLMSPSVLQHKVLKDVFSSIGASIYSYFQIKLIRIIFNYFSSEMSLSYALIWLINSLTVAYNYTLGWFWYSSLDFQTPCSETGVWKFLFSYLLQTLFQDTLIPALFWLQIFLEKMEKKRMKYTILNF